MSTENDSIAIDRDIGNFFYNVTATRDAGVGLTEKTIDYIVDVIRATRVCATRSVPT